MSNTGISKTYDQLFSDVKIKAAAFDEIAKHFYARNFGTMSKSDMETLMFSIYIEQIISQDDKNYSAYSDYTLAKELGIPQSKVSNLKVKKQLQYPYNYDWLESFAKISNRAKYEGGNIKIQIPDINLYYDIKNAIEEAGGFVEVTLNRGLLVVPLSYFLDFMVTVIPNGEDRNKLTDAIQNKFREDKKDNDKVEKESLGVRIGNASADTIADILAGVASQISGPLATVLICVSTVVKNSLKVING